MSCENSLYLWMLLINERDMIFYLMASYRIFCYLSNLLWNTIQSLIYRFKKKYSSTHSDSDWYSWLLSKAVRPLIHIHLIYEISSSKKLGWRTWLFVCFELDWSVTRGGGEVRLCPPHYCWHPQIFWPSTLPESKALDVNRFLELSFFNQCQFW